MNLDLIREALQHPNMQAFLRTIRMCEGTPNPSGYLMHFGGSLFNSFADHPRKRIRRKAGKGHLESSAAGAYQILERTWDDVQKVLKLPDFKPQSQDVAAVFLINRRGALEDVLAGHFEDAVKECAEEWASLPGSPYGQPTKPMRVVRACYEEYGGKIA